MLDDSVHEANERKRIERIQELEKRSSSYKVYVHALRTICTFQQLYDNGWSMLQIRQAISSGELEFKPDDGIPVPEHFRKADVKKSDAKVLRARLWLIIGGVLGLILGGLL